MSAAQDSTPVTLLLECGASYLAKGYGDFSKPRGSELVFCTAMSGIEESLTDPSFAGQLVLNTVSHVGNTGFTREDMESEKIWAEGLVCRHLEQIPSNWRAKASLKDWIVSEGRYVIEGVDTRELTVLLREIGSQRALVFETASMTPEQARSYLVDKVPSMEGQDLLPLVSCRSSYLFKDDPQAYWPMRARETWNGPSRKVVVWDFGVKKNTLRLLAANGFDVEVYPANSKAEDILASGAQGIMLSNGPGDPASATYVIAELKKVMGRMPIFAICLGHQLVAHAVGAKTYKMKFGHRGIHHPVVELDEKGKPVRTWITSQNHGFAVDASTLPSTARVSFIHGDDESVEGLSLPSLRCETVQFHPEAGPGPYDAAGMIDSFAARMGSDAR
ncbi:MAG: glutamine-hydrolyzing carbamoyl-phosphate synthase small subunit [Bdellovibrionota bacterium]